MARERMILCGSVDAGRVACEDKYPVRLRLHGPHANVNLKIEDMSRALWSDVPKVFHDLIEVATFVYCADQATSRGGDGVEVMGANWRRELFFRIPVRDPDFWSSPNVQKRLTDVLSFLSEDTYHLEFCRLVDPPTFRSYFEFGYSLYDEPFEEVILFSGGLDSLGGAVQSAVVHKRNVVLVNHRSTEKLTRRHHSLLDGLRRHAGKAPPMHVAVRVNKKRSLSREYTQRSRSFLYASLGATIATMLRLNRLRFFENGIVSLNLPPSQEVVGARATRTIHPRVLAGFQDLFSLVADRTFTVENAFRSVTKTEVVKLIAAAGCADLLPRSTSCTHAWRLTKQHTHCGECSQCIDRRFAILAAQQEETEPAATYRVDLLAGPRNDAIAHTMLASYVEMAIQVGKMTITQFLSRYGELTRALPFMDGTPDVAALQAFKLFQRHSAQVTEVVDAAVAQSAKAIRNRELPANCLVRLVCDGSYARDDVLITQTANPNARVPLSDNVFRQKGSAWIVRFNCRHEFLLLSTKGAVYLHHLLAHPGRAFTVAQLAVSAIASPQQFVLGGAGPSSDAESLSAFRQRFQELEIDLATAKRDGDSLIEKETIAEMSRLADEIKKVQAELRRNRRDCDDKERLRKSVGNAIRRVIKEIKKYDSRLAEHLSQHRLTLGLNPCYRPDEPVEWET